MRQKVIDTGITRLLIVESEYPIMYDKINVLSVNDSENTAYGKWEPICLVGDMTEDIAKPLVRSDDFYEPWSQNAHQELFFNYKTGGFNFQYSAKDSFDSLLDTNNIYLDYSRPQIPDTLSETFTNVDHLEMTLDVVHKMDNSWDKSRTYVLNEVK